MDKARTSVRTRQSRTRRRRGFTLPEVLVTIAIVAVLAAVVIPAVGTQISKGDQGKVSSDLLGVRGAVEQFLSDVRAYPNSIGQLTNKPAATTNGQGPIMSGATGQYTAQQVARWRGPYLNKDSNAAVVTGYGQSITLAFDTMTVGSSGVVSINGSGTGIKYLVVLLPGIDATTAASLDAAMDDNNTSTGMVRYAASGSTGTIKLLAAPIQP